MDHSSMTTYALVLIAGSAVASIASGQTRHPPTSAAMGFDQAKTTHRFTLKPDGGIIRVEVTDAADAAGRDRVRTHLETIAREFSGGDFEKPFHTHGEVPPGVPTLQRLKASITYTYEEVERGGLVRITTADREALDAVHAFLRYQIKEHGK